VPARGAPARLSAAALALSVLAAALPWAPAAAGQERVHGRLFPPEDLGLLEGPDRDRWQQPGQIMDALGIADGSVVADIGAGGGWFTIRLARRVGPRGLVYAEDVQTQMIEAIDRRVQREGLQNVRTVLGTDADAKLPADAVDAVLIVDAYHEVQDRVALLGSIARALKPTGRLGIVDFKQDGGGPGPPLEERMEPGEIVRDAERAGLVLLSHERFLPFQYLLIFGKRAGADSSSR